MMDLAARLNELVAAHDLNQHPFYQEWRDGTLPQSTLATYAEEYGQLVALMPAPWTLLGDPAIAAEEREHIKLWDNFAACLGTSVPAHAQLAEVRRLIGTAQTLFARRPTALGALYAFEVQQPSTAASKLAGLLRYYPQLDAQLYTDYFVAHARNQHESAALLALMAELDSAEVEQAVAACEQMCRALWDALSGIHGTGMSCPSTAEA